MKKYFDILRACSLFDQIEDEELLPLLDCLGAQVACYDKKETVIAEGKPAEHLGIVLSGSVQMIRVDYSGNRSIVSDARVSEVFGESFACAEVSSIPVAVVADEAAEVMMIDCRRIMRSCAHACGFHQQLIYNLMKDLAEKNILFHQKLEVTSQRSTRDKLLTYLYLQAKKTGSRRFTIPFDRQELADYLEVDRSGLSAEISRLRREGILECDRSYFVLLG